jgi:hypothetical protein
METNKPDDKSDMTSLLTPLAMWISLIILSFGAGVAGWTGLQRPPEGFHAFEYLVQ